LALIVLAVISNVIEVMWLGLLNVANITRMKVRGSRVCPPASKKSTVFNLRDETTSYNAVYLRRSNNRFSESSPAVAGQSSCLIDQPNLTNS